jgi:O-antigen/teichoic acid export membrane protein
MYVALINLVSVPILLSWLGVEAFGLVGLLATVQALFSILDAGVSSAVIRDTAQSDSAGTMSRDSLEIIRAVERVYWISTPVFFVVAVGFAWVFARSWVKGATIGPGEVFFSLALLSIATSLLWPTSYYNAVLYGMRRQGTVAWISSLTMTLRIGGGLACLALLGHRPVVFFACQVAATAVGVILLHAAVLRAIPNWRMGRGTLRSMLAKLGSSATAVSAVSTTLLIFNQQDKVIVGKLSSLETFGYYSLAWQLAGALYLIYNPVYMAYLPEICRAWTGDSPRAEQLTSDAMSVMSMLVLPIAAVVTLLPVQVLYAWTGDMTVADNTAVFLSLAFGGAAVNAMIFIPYAVQQASSTTKITLRAVIPTILVSVPLMTLGALLGGPAWAVATWAATSCLQVGMVLYGTAKNVLQQPPLAWCHHNVLSFGLPAVGVAAAVRFLMPTNLPRMFSVLAVSATYLACIVAMMILNRKARDTAWTLWRRLSGLRVAIAG